MSSSIMLMHDSDAAGLVVTSKQGVVTISGIVQRRQEKERIEGIIRTALTTRELIHAPCSGP